ncbi:MAG: UvrD-helicase domain-containing protein [Pseudomonadota bacterium]
MAQTTLAREPADPPYTQGLNDAQRAAVLATEGPVLMLAGAGTGKTKALTTRLAHIVATRRAPAWNVLAVTFTNKAAREMKERVAALIGPAAESMRWMGTFHSVAAQILRRHAELVGLKPTFTILDADDALRLCKQVISAAGLDEKRWTGRGLAALIDEWKNKGLVPAKVPEDDAWRFADGKAIELYTAYQERLIALNAVDFGDLLLHNLTIFQKHADVLADFQSRFRYVMVDEYQDTNVAQYLWLRLLAQGHKNICCVGDDDQSIYGWRGAEVENILRFEKDFPGAQVIRLERNYRSTGHILGAASGVIARNTARLGKTLWTEDADGEKVQVRGLWDAEEEARLVGEDIEQEQRKGRSLSDMAVLVRASHQMRAFEERFNTLGVPYKVVGGPRFYEREETKDALSYLRLCRSPDDDLSFERVVNKPARKIGAKTIQTLQGHARHARASLHAVTRQLLETDEIRGPAKGALARFLDDLDRWRAFSDDAEPKRLTELVLEESGYTDYWKTAKSPQAASKLDNLKELVDAVGEFETLEGYLDHVALVSELNAETADGQVWLMTLHAAKGLEFPVVFLPGWEEGVFPSQRSIDDKGNDGLEEERRLAYVGLTRARESARISFVANRQIFGRWMNALPSRFVEELPQDHAEVVSEPGLYGVSAKELAGASRFNATKLEDDTYYDNPGWRRARAAEALKKHERGRSEPPLIEARASVVSSASPGRSKYGVGERVFHQKFGYGSVLAVEGNKLTVNFEHSGPKKVVESFLEKH